MTQICLPRPRPFRLCEPMAAWGSPEFRDELRAWVESVAGPVVEMQQAKLRPWATVWQVRTAERLFYAKQNCPGQLFEAGVVALLARLAPEYVVPVAAVDAERGLLLTPDQGQVFGETVAEGDLDSWCRLVARAMELARTVAQHAEDLVAAGVTRCRVPDHAPQEVLALVEASEEEMGSLGLPETLVHNDLHAHNAFHHPSGLIFFDFADAVVAHPLAGLLVPLNVLADQLGRPGPHDARLRRVADAGLEVWSDVAPPRALRAALPAALRLGRLGRAESWARVTPDLADEDVAEYGPAADAWLARIPDPVPVSFD